MSFMSRLPASWKDRPPPRPVDLDLSSPALAVAQLERLLYTGRVIVAHADEVWPRLYIGDQSSAENRAGLADHRVTHVLNANHSARRDGAQTYRGTGIAYLGIEARDSAEFDMSANFNTAADFIHRGLSSGGTVLVHCAVGVSRSATLVLAYLMLRQRLTLAEAVCAVKENRGVVPNRGFLRQLLALDARLHGRHRPTVV